MNIRSIPILFKGIHFDESAPGPVAEPIAPSAPVAPSLKERVSSLQGPAREHWQMTGDLDAAEALTKPDVTAASSPAISETPATEVETEAASEPAVEEQPKTGETPEQKAERKHRSDMRRLRDLGKAEARASAAEAKAALLEKQIAESQGASAPPRKEEKPVVDPSKPKRPRLKDFTSEDDYDAAMDKYEVARDQWMDQSLEQRATSQTQAQQFREASEKWETGNTKARAKYKDFDAVAFNPKTPASLPQILETQARDDAHEVMYYLGQHPDVSAKIADLTDIPVSYGKFNTAAELHAAMANNPGLAYLVGEKRGLAKAELNSIGELLKKATPSPKASVAHIPKPSGEVAVDSNTAPAGDDDSSLIKRAAQGDKTAARIWKERENKRELQEAGQL